MLSGLDLPPGVSSDISIMTHLVVFVCDHIYKAWFLYFKLFSATCVKRPTISVMAQRVCYDLTVKICACVKAANLRDA